MVVEFSTHLTWSNIIYTSSRVPLVCIWSTKSSPIPRSTSDILKTNSFPFLYPGNLFSLLYTQLLKIVRFVMPSMGPSYRIAFSLDIEWHGFSSVNVFNFLHTSNNCFIVSGHLSSPSFRRQNSPRSFLLASITIFEWMVIDILDN